MQTQPADTCPGTLLNAAMRLHIEGNWVLHCSPFLRKLLIVTVIRGDSENWGNAARTPAHTPCPHSPPTLPAHRWRSKPWRHRHAVGAGAWPRALRRVALPQGHQAVSPLGGVWMLTANP